ncbi:MAG: hypothetical protein HOW73_32605 [Polyangiaceae bacterium]|nr:hypothetical protein [Polyangiaceae bacterium]
MLEKTLALGPILACSALLGCHADIVIEEDDDSDTPLRPECHDAPDTATPIDVSLIESATLIGDALHMDAVVKAPGDELGVRTYAVVELFGDLGAIETYPNMGRGADWSHLHGSYYARIGDSNLEVADMNAPLAISSGVPISGWNTASGRHLGVDDSQVFLCMKPEGIDTASVYRIDLTDVAHPGAPTRYDDGQPYALDCARESQANVIEGSLWAFIRSDDDPQSYGYGGDVTLFDLTGPSLPMVSHGFSGNGVHQYGTFDQAATDGSVVVTTLTNPAYAFLYYRDQSPEIVYSSFGSNEKNLLAVVEGLAILAVPSGEAPAAAIVAYDVEDPARTVRTRMNVELAASRSDFSRYRHIAHDAERIVVTDGDQIYVVPIDGTQPATPLHVARYTSGQGPICE